MWHADGSSLVPGARIVECDRAKAILSSKTDLKTSHDETNGHVRPGLLGHFIVDPAYAYACVFAPGHRVLLQDVGCSGPWARPQDEAHEAEPGLTSTSRLDQHL